MFLISEEPVEGIRSFAEQKSFGFPFLKHEGALADIGIAALPRTLVLDADGKVVYSKTGGFTTTADVLYTRIVSLDRH